MPSIAATLVLLALPAVLLTAPGDAEASLDADAQRCLRSVGQALATSSRVAGESATGCIAAFAAGGPDELPGGTIERCIGFDPTVWQSRDTSSARSRRLCEAAQARSRDGQDPRLELGFPSAFDAALVGHRGSMALLHDLFGEILDESLRTVGQAPSAQRCQRAAWLASRACAEARQLDFQSCLRDALSATDPLQILRSTRDLGDRCLGLLSEGQPDTAGWIARRCTDGVTGIAGVLERRCAGEDPSALFPGCSAEASAADCIERKIACRTCLSVNRALGTRRNCDRFDNGVDDGTCGCGDGMRTPFEQCDDGNDIEYDACTSTCTEVRAACPCYTTEAIDAAFPPGFFTPFDRRSCVDDELGVAFASGTCRVSLSHDLGYSVPRLGAGIIDGSCFFHPTPQSENDGDECRSPEFEGVARDRIADCRIAMRRSQAWQRECER